MGAAAQGPRYDETFPTLTAKEIDRIRRFGSLLKYSSGERLFETGEPGPGMFVVMSGSVAITQRDGLGHVDSGRRARRGSVLGRDWTTLQPPGAGRRNRGGRCRDAARSRPMAFGRC